MDIDYILGNTQKTRRKPSKGIAFSSYKTQDPLRDLFGIKPSHRAKPKSNIVNQDFLSGFMGQGHPRPDRKTKQQKAFLKKTRIGTGKSHLRFMDLDGDGVIAGLDCEYKNPKRHGTKMNRLLREKMRNQYDYNWGLIKGATEHEEKVIEGTFKRYPDLQKEFSEKGVDMIHTKLDRGTLIAGASPPGKEKAVVLYKKFYDMPIDVRAKTLKHELRHLEQDPELRGSSQENMEVSRRLSEKEMSEKEYYSRPSEYDAERTAETWAAKRKFGYLDDDEINTISRHNFNVEGIDEKPNDEEIERVKESIKEKKYQTFRDTFNEDNEDD